MQLKNFSVRALQAKTGIDSSHISRIFCGKPFNEATLKRLAIAMETSPIEIYRQIEEIRSQKKEIRSQKKKKEFIE